MALLATMDITSKGWVLFTQQLRDLWKKTWLSLIFIVIGNLLILVADETFPAMWVPNMALSIVLTLLGLLLLAYFYSHIYVTATRILWTGYGQEYTNTLSTTKLILSFLFVSIFSSLIIGIGFLLLIIPGIMFLTWYQFAQYTLLIDNQHGLKALKTSKELVKGRFWAVLGRMILLMIIFVVFSFVTDIPEKIILYIVDQTNTGVTSHALWMLFASTISMIGAFFVGLFALAADLVFFHNVKTTPVQETTKV